MPAPHRPTREAWMASRTASWRTKSSVTAREVWRLGGERRVGLAERDGEDDVPARYGDERVLRARAVAPDELDDAAGERDEVALGRVEEVRQAAAVAVVGEGQDARDPMALGLDVHV